MPIKADILRQLQAGDPGAWDAVLREHDALIRAVVGWSKWCFNETVQQEVAQQVRTELVKAADRLTAESSLLHFIKKVCIRRCIDEVRRQYRRRQHFVPMQEMSDDSSTSVFRRDYAAGREWDPVREIILHERARVLRDILGGLDATCREAIRRFYLDGKSYKEMADELGLSINTVGSRLSKCLNKLREMIEKSPAAGEVLLDSYD